MKTSSAGIEIIKRNEGCRLVAYLDTVASPARFTIGYGDTKGVYDGLEITQQEAEDRLFQRLEDEFEPAVASVCVVPTTQSQFDAMVSLAWNIGASAFKNQSSVARFHRIGQYDLAAESFMLWNKAGGKVVKGLTRRREEERTLYLSEPAVPTASVASVQTRLKELGYDLVVDGIAGRQTCAAILRALADQPTVVI